MVFFTSLAILGIGAWHSSTVYSEVEFWGKYRVYAESSPLNPICSVKQQAVDDGQMNSFHCLCDDVGDYNAAGYTGKFLGFTFYLKAGLHMVSTSGRSELRDPKNKTQLKKTS